MLSNVIAPAEAYGAEAVPGSRQSTQLILELGRKLRDVVVNPQNADAYRQEIEQLLNLSARHQVDAGPLDGPARIAWPLLIKAAAWQESCWRQFVIKNQRIWYLESSTGDIGLMQVNKYVWRGFYSLRRLEWDIVYNAGAGSEILMRLLNGAVRHVHSSDPATLARATYAAYNGGPGAYRRWQQAHEPKVLRDIDQAFWLKYRAIAGGGQFDIVRCAEDWGRTHAD